MENRETIFYGNEKSEFMIVKMKYEERLRIFSKNEEIFLEDEYPCNTYSSEISELFFKLTNVTNSIWFKKKAIQDSYYIMISSIIALCLNLKNRKNEELKEMKKEITDKINFINSKLTDEIIAKNKSTYLTTYIGYLIAISSILILTKINLNLQNPKNLRTISLIVMSFNMGGIGGLIALCFRIMDNKSFSYSFITRNYIAISFTRAIYSSCAGIMGYFIFISLNADNTKAVIANMYLLSAALGYSTKFLPSILNKIGDGQSSKKE